MEDGTITLIGATTENPSFYVNNALLSRCRVVTLDKLSVVDVEQILTRALERLAVETVNGDTEGRLAATTSDSSHRSDGQSAGNNQCTKHQLLIVDVACRVYE